MNVMIVATQPYECKDNNGDKYVASVTNCNLTYMERP